ncbi:MAG: histidine--tRNA ligase, partial [Vicinamibacteria bacterium]|nr:histidine--tRNA ligase [Vicinamibacteria bacterium]
IEHLLVLSGSAGAETQTSIFRVQGPDDDVLGLRFDLTVPLARLIAQYPDLPKPFRRYQVAPVWRADKPGPGRFREFTQFDLDSVGVPSEIADTEIIAGMCDTLTAIECGPYRVRFSSRKVLNLLMPLAGIDSALAADVFRVLDKLDKIGIEKVRKELTTGYKDESGDTIEGVGLHLEQVGRIERFLAIQGATRDEILAGMRDVFGGVPGAQEAIGDLSNISRHLAALGYHEDRAVIDLSIARGLAYYTGPVFEAVLLEAPEFGSIFGGGRYDDLVMRFLGERVPATGASIGVDRLLAALIKLGRTGKRRATAHVLVTAIDSSLTDDYLAITYELRRAGIPTEMYLGAEQGLGRQIKYADRSGIPLVLIYGSDEKAKGTVTLKDLEAGAAGAAQLARNREQWRQLRPGQFEVARADLIRAVRDFSSAG